MSGSPNLEKVTSFLAVAGKILAYIFQFVHFKALYSWHFAKLLFYFLLLGSMPKFMFTFSFVGVILVYCSTMLMSDTVSSS